MKNIKICRIISAYSPFSIGGADIYAEKISRELVKRGNSTVVITINPNGGDTCEEDSGTKIYRFHPFNVSNVHKIGKKPFFYQGLWTLLDTYSYYSYYKIKQILEKEKPDIVHLHTPLDVTLSAFNAVKALGLPLVYTLHDFLLLCKRVILSHPNGQICDEKNMNPFCRVYREFSKTIANRSIDLVIAPSKFCLNLYKEHGFFINTECKILPNGIDLDMTQQKDAQSQMPRNKEFFTILYSGGLTRHKGVDVLIKAFREIQNNNLKLNIVGDGILDKELKRLATGDNRITFCGKFANKEMRQFYRDADIVVVPSIVYDVRPNVIPEAYRDGVPVIGANIGGIPELIIDKQTGFLFEPGDYLDLKHKLKTLINNPQILASLSKNCLEFVKQFEMEGYLNKLQMIYKQAIEINHHKNYM